MRKVLIALVVAAVVYGAGNVLDVDILKVNIFVSIPAVTQKSKD